MSQSDRKKWDKKHATSPNASFAAPEWLVTHLIRLPPGRALDLATGTGSSAIELARRGWNVTAIDISAVGIGIAAKHADLLGVRLDWIVADLDDFRLPPDRFDVITVFNYLEREMLPGEIVRSLRPGGVVVFETYTVDQLRVPGNHMRNPKYLLQPGELLMMFAELRVRAYREVIRGDQAVASLVAEKVANR